MSRNLPDEDRKILLENLKKNGGVVKACAVPNISKNQKMPHERRIEKGQKVLREKIYVE